MQQNNKEEEVIITIPVYSTELTDNEKHSLEQCINVLNKYPITLICGQNFDIKNYKKVFKALNKDFTCIKFDDKYFSNRDSYSKLCLSECFYEKFNNYKFMLIYQLDAFVFKDELEYWCKQNYDYIGAPWNLKVLSEIVHTKIEYGGNGGFSLRKIDTMIRLMKHNLKNKNIYAYKSLKYIFNIYKKRTFISNLLNIPKYVFIYLFQRFIFNKEIFNEDLIIAKYARKYIKDFYFAEPNEAAKFSIESFGEYFFNINGKVIPFGTHAYLKHLDFWTTIKKEARNQNETRNIIQPF